MEATPCARRAHRSDDERVSPPSDTTHPAAAHLPPHQISESLPVQFDPVVRQQRRPQLLETQPLDRARGGTPHQRAEHGAPHIDRARVQDGEFVDAEIVVSRSSVSFTPGSVGAHPAREERSPLSELDVGNDSAARRDRSRARVHLSPKWTRPRRRPQGRMSERGERSTWAAGLDGPSGSTTDSHFGET